MRAVVISRWLFLAAIGIVSAGCGQARTEVTGEVTYNGSAIAESPMGGTISFFGPDGISVTTAIDAKGQYRAKGVCIGENKVAVCYQRPITKAANKRVPSAEQAPVAVAGDSPYLIPEKYVSPETSELKVTVTSNMVYNVKLTAAE